MKPIYVSREHEVIVESYLDMVFTTINELVIEQDKVQDFLDISEVIIDYHNQYNGVKEIGNFHDFLMIIPVNFSTMVSGFLCGYEKPSNASACRIHRHLLSNFGLKVIEDLNKIETIHE
tara:strand:- start:6487 stop:6843 length:357 start_codon:yes stop_codon:yes gene_type:complete